MIAVSAFDGCIFLPRTINAMLPEYRQKRGGEPSHSSIAEDKGLP